MAKMKAFRDQLIHEPFRSRFGCKAKSKGTLKVVKTKAMSQPRLLIISIEGVRVYGDVGRSMVIL